MKRQIISIALTLCLCISAIPAAYAEESIPTPQEVYETLIVLKDQDGYREGTPWDNSSHSYDWNGGPVAGNITGGYGCAAFAFELSDIAFGSLRARTLTTGAFQLSDVRAGDILRINNNSHSVIVLQVTEGGAVIAEANYSVNGGPGAVHWNRSLSKAEVEAADYFITRYPEGYTPPDDPSAGGELGSGSLGSLSWKLTKAGTLTISGSGAMPDFPGSPDAPWSGWMDKILTLVVENGVSHLGGHSFDGAALVSVTLPGSLRSIGDSAFYGCANLVSVSIPEGVETIGASAFQACSRLSSITLPSGIRSLGDAAFSQCWELTEAAFKQSAGNAPVAMGNSLFAQCRKLSRVTLPQAADCIADNMFTDCLLLTSVDIPQGVTRIGERAFASCPLRSVYIPSSVEEIALAAFPLPATLKDVYFGGDAAAWDSIPKLPTTTAALAGATIHYGKEPPEETPPPPEGHKHSWSPDWSSDGSHHWHECLAEDCGITENSGKSGYGAHSYGDWVTDQPATSSQSGSRHRTCTACGYTQTERIPATGGGSSGGSGSGGSSGGSGSNASGGSSSGSTPPSSATTTRNPDGSTTTTKTDNRTGTVTKTTQYPDGSKTVIETQKNGTVTTWETDRIGNKTKTVAKPDGSTTVTAERKDGVTAVIATSAAGRTEAEIRLSAPVVSAARERGEAVSLPIPEVQPVRASGDAPSVTVHTGSAAAVKVEIPVSAPTPGTVAVLVRGDGSLEILRNSVPTADGVTVSLPDGATVKIVDNRKDFQDVPSSYWGAAAIDFVCARELFSGTSETTFVPDAPMTRAMLMMVLARLDGADTDGGAVWYEKGMEWAVSKGISDGSRPDQSISREQLITMLWRYAGSPAASGGLPGFADADQISGYARAAMAWALERGVVSGFGDGRLGPQGQAVRSQVAQMLKNFMEKQP